jgi:hypothetical protein
MQDKELYQQILGLVSPWRVARVRMDVEHEEIVVEVEHPAQIRVRPWKCLWTPDSCCVKAVSTTSNV